LTAASRAIDQARTAIDGAMTALLATLPPTDEPTRITHLLRTRRSPDENLGDHRHRRRAGLPGSFDRDRFATAGRMSCR